MVIRDKMLIANGAKWEKEIAAARANKQLKMKKVMEAARNNNNDVI